jgi:hypothetical protein
MKPTNSLWNPVLDRGDSVFNSILIQHGCSSELELASGDVYSGELMVVVIDGAPGGVCRMKEIE